MVNQLTSLDQLAEPVAGSDLKSSDQLGEPVEVGVLARPVLTSCANRLTGSNPTGSDRFSEPMDLFGHDQCVLVLISDQISKPVDRFSPDRFGANSDQNHLTCSDQLSELLDRPFGPNWFGQVRQNGRPVWTSRQTGWPYQAWPVCSLIWSTEQVG